MQLIKQAPSTGLEINEKIQLQLCVKVRKFSRNFANSSRKTATVHCVVSGLAKQNMSPQHLCVQNPLKMANDQRNRVVHVTSQLNHVQYRCLQIDRKFTAKNKIVLSFLYLF